MTGQGQFVAYTSSSSTTTFLGDLATISYNQVRMAILNHQIPKSGGEISFIDVSMHQQQDFASCVVYVYALENAHRQFYCIVQVNPSL